MSVAEGATRVREALAEKVAATARSLREIERELGWGQGTLNGLLHGRTEVKLRHIEALAPVIGSTPLELLEEIYEEELPADAPPEWGAFIRPLLQLGDKARILGRVKLEKLLLMVAILSLVGYEEDAAWRLSPLVRDAAGAARKKVGETPPKKASG